MLTSKFFHKIVKNQNIILKVEPTTIIHAHWDRWVSYDVIKHHVINSKVGYQISFKHALKLFFRFIKRKFIMLK